MYYNGSNEGQQECDDKETWTFVLSFNRWLLRCCAHFRLSAEPKMGGLGSRVDKKSLNGELFVHWFANW